MGKILAILLVAVVLILGAAGAGAYFYGMHVYEAPGPATPDGAPRFVMIDKGSSSGAIAARLKQAGAIGSDFDFRMAIRVLDIVGLPDNGKPASPKKPGKVKMRAGEYAIPSGASIEKIIHQLSEGDVVLYAVIVPEGLTSATVVDLLASREWAANGDWKTPAGKPLKTIKLAGGTPAAIPAEGSLLPGDYTIQPGDTIQSVLERMAAAQKDLMTKAWPTREANLPIQTPEEAVILASIVEKETGAPEERPQVAAVFTNRLRQSVRIESDPTIIYGVCKQLPDHCKDGKLVNEKGERRVIRQSEIDLVTGYNTYRIDRLPPTPICNPGKDALMAVLNPPDSNAMFFVADGSGRHVFSATYAEHQANVAKWRKAEAAALAVEAEHAKEEAAKNAPPAAAPPAAKPAPARSPKPKPADAPATSAPKAGGG